MVLPHLLAAACAHMQIVDVIKHKMDTCISGKLARKYHSIIHIPGSFTLHLFLINHQPSCQPHSQRRKHKLERIYLFFCKTLVPVYATHHQGDIFIQISYLWFLQSDSGMTRQAIPVQDVVLRRQLYFADFAFHNFQVFSVFLGNSHSLITLLQTFCCSFRYTYSTTFLNSLGNIWKVTGKCTVLFAHSCTVQQPQFNSSIFGSDVEVLVHSPILLWHKGLTSLGTLPPQGMVEWLSQFKARFVPMFDYLHLFS